jgi:hypothetical protein
MGKVNKAGREKEKQEEWVTRSGMVLTEEIAERWAEEIEQNPRTLPSLSAAMSAAPPLERQATLPA